MKDAVHVLAAAGLLLVILVVVVEPTLDVSHFVVAGSAFVAAGHHRFWVLLQHLVSTPAFVYHYFDFLRFVARCAKVFDNFQNRFG